VRLHARDEWPNRQLQRTVPSHEANLLMSGTNSSETLRSRAAAFLRGPCCFSRDEPRPTAVGLIQRYVAAETLDDDELSRCIRYALIQAEGTTGATGSERDSQRFYQRAAAILQEIQAELSVGRS